MKQEKICFWGSNYIFSNIFDFFTNKRLYFLYLYLEQSSVFGLWWFIFNLLTPESIYFLHIYKNSDRLLGHLTYFIFEPPSLLICGLQTFLGWANKLFCRFLKFGLVLALGFPYSNQQTLREINFIFFTFHLKREHNLI
jgi:hypothetical protein